MNVVVVESPAKAKTINKYLGPGYTVLASYGHVRDLPSKDGSVRPDEDFDMSWEVDPKAAKRLADIADADEGGRPPDPGHRPGSRGRGHLLARAGGPEPQEGDQGRRGRAGGVQRHHQVRRHRGHAANPRQIDMELVEAYLARRALDYLVGFTLSPVLWRKLPGARSAGRVQSVALRLVVDREIEIERFKTQEYWTVEADVSAGTDPFMARLIKLDRKRLGKFDLPDEATARPPARRSKIATFPVTSVEKKPARRSPAAALHHLNPAAGGRPQARLLRPAHHAGRAEAL